MKLFARVGLGGFVEGLGDEEIPWWLAPYVRDFVGLANSSTVLEARNAYAAAPMPHSALVDLTSRIAALLPVARAASHTAKEIPGGIAGSLSADIDEYCGTPPKPHRLQEAGLAVSLVAASLRAHDSAKGLLVNEAQRIQNKLVSGTQNR